MLSKTFPSEPLEEGCMVVTTGRVQILAEEGGGVDTASSLIVDEALREEKEYTGVDVRGSSEFAYTTCCSCLPLRYSTVLGALAQYDFTLSAGFALAMCEFESADFFLFASSDIAVGLRMVNFVYFTGGWLTQFTPTTEDEMGPKGVGEGRLAAAELVGDWEEVEVEEVQELRLCFPIRMFSTVKLEMALLLDTLGVVFLMTG